MVMEVRYAPNCEGYSAKPQNPNGMALILIHEFWGLNQQMKNVALRAANEGFAALAIDLYKGKIATDANEARRMKEELKTDEALENIRSAVSYFGTLGIKPEKVGIWGFCMGGGVTFEAATRGVKTGAYVIYYGRVLDDEEVLSNIPSPILGIFGGLDKGIPKDLVFRFCDALKKMEKPCEVYVYEDADHAFANEERPVYNETAAKDAWSKTITFLNKYL